MPEPSKTPMPPEDVASGRADPGIACRHRSPGKPRSLGSDAWHDLRRNPMFVVSALLILLLILVAAFPALFTSTDPKFCDLTTTTGAAHQGTRSGSTGRAVTSTPG